MALAGPVLGHLDPEFLRMLDDTNDRLRRVFATSNALTLPVSGTGSAGHGGLVRELRAARPTRSWSGSTASSASGCARWRVATAPTSSVSTPHGASRSTRSGSWPPTRRPRSSPWCTPRRRRGCATTSRHSEGQGRRTAAGGHGHLPGGHRGRGRRVGGGHRVQRHAEVPGCPARSRAPDRLAAGLGPARRATVELVPRPQPPGALRQRRLRRAGVPPHGPGGHGGRPACRPGGPARRGPRGRAGRVTPSAAGCSRTGWSASGSSCSSRPTTGCRS